MIFVIDERAGIALNLLGEIHMMHNNLHEVYSFSGIQGLPEKKGKQIKRGWISKWNASFHGIKI